MTQHIPDSDLGGLARSMTRHIIRISLVMLLGVVTSVAVAWGYAWHFKRYHQAIITTPPLALTGVHHGELFSHKMPMPDGQLYQAIIRSRRGTSRMVEIITSPQMSLPTNGKAIASRPQWAVQSPFQSDERIQLAAGWPLRCVRGNITRSHSGDVVNAQALINQCIPYAPILPGLLANTAIYGGVWWAMLFGPGMFIRWRRTRAGRCVKCGYDLRGATSAADACPECGVEA